MAPDARAIDSAAACCGPSKSGSKSEVRSGIVPGVEMTCWGVDGAAADVPAVATARTLTADTAQQDSTTRANAWRDVTFQRKTLNRTGGDGSQAFG